MDTGTRRKRRRDHPGQPKLSQKQRRSHYKRSVWSSSGPSSVQEMSSLYKKKCYRCYGRVTLLWIPTTTDSTKRYKSYFPEFDNSFSSINLNAKPTWVLSIQLNGYKEGPRASEHRYHCVFIELEEQIIQSNGLNFK